MEARDEHLAAVAGGGDAGCAVHVRADVALLGYEGRTGVDADPHLDGAGGECVREGLRCRERSGGGREGGEEGVSLRVDLDPALRGERFTRIAPVLGERRGVSLRAELVQELSRALDVREEEGDGAAGKVRPHGEIIRPNRARLKQTLIVSLI